MRKDLPQQLDPEKLRQLDKDELVRIIVEQAIAIAEAGDAGFACSSGMAAIQTVMGLFSQGDHLLVSVDLYGGTYRLFEQVLTRYGLSFTYVDMREADLISEAIRPETKALFVETPTNPLMQIADLSKLLVDS